jgi:2-oxoglutarate ferredoxin oxidoreductase subunit beta
MTGGQMAPTSLPGQKTTTSPYGRDVNTMGYPVKVVELLNTLQAPKFLARVSVHNPQNVQKAKETIRKAFELQVAGKGFTLVEVLSTCPTNWGMSPVEALKWLEANMIPQFPLGVVRAPKEVAR